MNIPGVLESLTSLIPGNKNAPVDDASPAAADVTAEGASTSAALRKIVAHYDMRNISPRQFSEMAQRLFDAGAITEEQLNELAAVRLELDRGMHEPDAPLDLIEVLEDKLRRQQKQQEQLAAGGGKKRLPAAGQAMKVTLRQLDWLRKFEIVGSGAYGSGVDALV